MTSSLRQMSLVVLWAGLVWRPVSASAQWQLAPVQPAIRSAAQSGQPPLSTSAAAPAAAPPSRAAAPMQAVLPPDSLPIPPGSAHAAEHEAVSRPVPDLSLSDFEQMALSQHPGLLQAAAQVQAARGQWLQSGLYPNPTFGYVGSELGNDAAAGMNGPYWGQEFVTAGKLGLNRAVEGQRVQQMQALFEAQRYRVINDVRTRFYAALVAQRMIEVTGRLEHLSLENVKTAEALLKAQEVSRVDLLQSRIEADSARIRSVQAQNRWTAAWRELAAVAAVPTLIPGRLAGDPAADIPTLDWDSSLARVLYESPELAAASAAVRQAEWAVRRARVEPIPNIDLQTSAQYDASTHYTVGNVQATVPLPLFNRNQGGIRRAEAELAAARGNVARMQLDLQQRLAQAFERYSNARRMVDIYQRSIVPQAQTSLDLVSSGYRQGEFDYVTLLVSQRTFFQAQLSYLEALVELRSSVVEIDGLLLTDSLQRPEN